MPALCKRRGTRRWRGQVKHPVTGNKVTQWFGTGRKGGPEYRAAVAWEEQTKAELEKESRTATVTASSMTLAWCNKYLDFSKRRHAAKVYDEKKSMLKRLIKALGPELQLEDFTPDIALAFLDDEMESRGGNAANRDRKNGSAAWVWGCKFIPSFPKHLANPFLMVPRYPEKRQDRYVPPEEDFWKVLAETDGQDSVMLMTFLHTAARRGEVFRLKWADINFGLDQLWLSSRKNREGTWERIPIPMTKELKERLLWWWEFRENKTSEYVFTVLDSTPFTNQWQGQPFVQRQHFMRRICEMAGVKPFGFHAIRHLTAVILYHAGYPVATIQAILRHHNAATTEKYLKRLGLDPERLANAMTVLEGRGGPGKVILMKTALGAGNSEG